MRLVELVIDTDVDYVESIKRNMSTCVKDIIKESYTQPKLNIHIYYINENNVDIIKNKIEKIKQKSIPIENIREVVVIYMDEILKRVLESEDELEAQRVIKFYDDLRNEEKSNLIIIFSREFKHSKSEKGVIQRLIKERNSYFRFMTPYEVEHSYVALIDNNFKIKTKKIK